MIWIETQRGIYRVHERQEGKGNPRIGDDYFTLNTPSQMQRECNVVAFGELTLSTRLKHKHENDTSKVRNRRCHQSVQLLNLSMLMISSTRGYCLHNRTSANSPSLHKPVHRLFNMNLALEILNFDNNLRCVKPAKRRGEWEITAARRQAEGCVMMTTNKRPLIMTWSKTAPKGTKRANVASTTMMWLAKLTGLS